MHKANKVKKAVISIILTFVILMTGFPVETWSENNMITFAAAVQTYKLGDNVTGVLASDGTLTISGTGAMYDYYIAEEKSPFYDNLDIVKLVIQNGVTYVGRHTFEECCNIKEVTIAGSVKEIGGCAFIGDSGIKTVKLEYGVEIIEYAAFQGCRGLGSINLVDSIKTIKGNAFYGCVELANVTLPSKLETLGRGAFGGCVNIKSINIPASVVQIEGGVFEACGSVDVGKEFALTSIYVDGNNRNYKSIDGVVYSKDGKSIVWYPEGRRNMKYSVKTGVEVIGRYAFGTGNKYLECIELPETVTKIEGWAFNRAEKLKKINLPDSLEYIGEMAFHSCWELDEIVIPKSVTYIGYCAFGNCRALKNITIYDTVKRIEHATINNGELSDYIFENCSKDLTVHLYKGSVIDKYMDDYDLGKREYSLPSKPAMNVEYRTEEQIRNYIKTHPVYMRYIDTYKTKPIVREPYSAGELTPDTLNNGLNTVNTIRYIAGLNGEVLLNNEYTNLAQASAMMIGINYGRLSHYPNKPAGMGDELYNAAYKGSCCSNIASGYSNLSQAIVKGWMNDGDISNIEMLGHRRWILNPFMRYTGFGEADYTTYYNGDVKRKGFAMYAMNQSNESMQYGVAWSAQTMPLEYFGADYPWSISLGNDVDEAGLKVKLTNVNTGKVWNFSTESADGDFYVNNAGYGQSGCIIFRPNNIKKYSAGDVYNVEVTGVKAAAIEDKFTYTVRFFNLEPVVYGDINDDGDIDTQDAVLIKKYLAGYKGLDINADACDVNGDGDITSADVVLLLKKLAGYNVTLGKK